MEESAIKIETIDAYISRYDEDIQAILQELRKLIKEEAPDATEKISYQMPTFYLNGNLVHFAVQKNPIPYELVRRIVRFRVEEAKQNKKQSK